MDADRENSTSAPAVSDTSAGCCDSRSMPRKNRSRWKSARVLPARAAAVFTARYSAVVIRTLGRAW